MSYSYLDVTQAVTDCLWRRTIDSYFTVRTHFQILKMLMQKQKYSITQTKHSTICQAFAVVSSARNDHHRFHLCLQSFCNNF